MREKRKRTRVEFSTKVIIKLEDSEIVTQSDTKDISLSGLYVQTDEKIPLNTKVDCKIILPGGIDEFGISIEGIVSRVDPNGFGINFVSMDPDSFAHLKNIAMYNSQDPDAIESEIINIPLR